VRIYLPGRTHSPKTKYTDNRENKNLFRIFKQLYETLVFQVIGSTSAKYIHVF